MGAFRAMFRAMLGDQRGLSTVEYVLVLVIVAITALLLWQTFGSSVGDRVDQATTGVGAMDTGGAVRTVPAGTSAGTEAAAAVTEGRESAAMEGGSGAGAGSDGRETPAAVGGASARRVDIGMGAAAAQSPAASVVEPVDEGPDLFLWIGWFIVAALGTVTFFSVLGKRVGKG